VISRPSSRRHFGAAALPTPALPVAALALAALPAADPALPEPALPEPALSGASAGAAAGAAGAGAAGGGGGGAAALPTTAPGAADCAGSRPSSGFFLEHAARPTINTITASLFTQFS
jgi:hypothetical protein